MKPEEVIIAPVRRAPLIYQLYDITIVTNFNQRIPSTKRTLCYYFRWSNVGDLAPAMKAKLTAWFVAPFSLRNLSFASQKLKAQLAHVRLLLGAYAYSTF